MILELRGEFWGCKRESMLFPAKALVWVRRVSDRREKKRNKDINPRGRGTHLWIKECGDHEGDWKGMSRKGEEGVLVS